MPIPWMVALKVIPWGDVIEHAPKVLNAARKLLDKKTGDLSTADVVISDVVLGAPGAPPPSLGELKNRLIAAQHQIDRQAQTQADLAQTLAELAEQNARLVAAVAVLRTRTRMLLWGAVVLTGSVIGLALR